MRAVSDVLDTAAVLCRFADDLAVPGRVDAVLAEVAGRKGLDVARSQLDLFREGAREGRMDRHGERVWVSPEMMELCCSAERSLPDDARLAAVDLPWPRATVVLASPLRLAVAPGRDVLLDILQWRIRNEPQDPPGAVVLGWTRHDGMTRPFTRVWWPFGESMGDQHLAFRFSYTLWCMLRQRIAVVSHDRGPRQACRRWQRRTGEDPADVLVVTLRRPESGKRSDGPGTDVEWTHQWIVGAHWRNQWYPSIQDHRPRYIAPYVKGPEGQPLAVKEKIYVWRR